MPETQNIEYKSSWHDDYLKWICGFANAQGGRIYIGKDDACNVVGVEDYKILMDRIPNKIKNNMGITTEVNLLQEGGRYYIEIIVRPYSVPISLRGRYYYRSGSVKQELTGASLNEFLLKRAGQTWDDIIEPRATFDDIDERTVNIYLKKAGEAGRLPDIDGLSIPDLLEKLRLVEDGHLKRAAIVLFGKDPGRFYPNTFVKIGKFEDDDFTIRFQETEEGNIIQVLEKVLNTLDKLTESHSSYPRNPVLAEACFRGGYIDSWGSGIMKIVNSCKVAGLPVPILEEDGGGFIVRLFKDIYSERELKNKGLNERQVDAVLFYKNKKYVTTSEYMKRYNIAERTARADLSDMVEKKIFYREGETKAVKYFFIK